MNEHGVTIGNEAVFTRPLKDRLDTLDDEIGAGDGTAIVDEMDIPYGILGMESVRHGLERARSAASQSFTKASSAVWISISAAPTFRSMLKSHFLSCHFFNCRSSRRVLRIP